MVSPILTIIKAQIFALRSQNNFLLLFRSLICSSNIQKWNLQLKSKSIHLLLVEDNEGDIVLIADAFEDAKIFNTISVVRDGQQALDFLYKTNGYELADEPDLIVLDVNLPKLNGHEVLKKIKSDKKLCHIPVIMLTTSSSPTDINKSYKNHVNCYITKPVDVDEFIKVVLSIESFWISIVQLPGNN